MSDERQSRIANLLTEINSLWLASAKEALLLDRDAAILAFNLCPEVADRVIAMTPTGLRRLAASRSSLVGFRPLPASFFASAETSDDVSQYLLNAFIQSVFFQEDNS